MLIYKNTSKTMSKRRDEFKFTTEFQWDLLKYSVQDKNGYRAVEKYEDSYFTLIEHQVIAYSIKRIYKRDGAVPGETKLREETLKTLNSTEFVNLVTKDDQKNVLSLIKNMYNSQVVDRDYIYSNTKLFKTYINFKDVLENIDINDFDSYANVSKQIERAIADEDEAEDFKSSFLITDIKNRQFKRQETKTIFPTPFKQINAITNAGGYEGGSIIVILDKQKRAKTATLVNVARGYLKMGKKVLYIDLENGEHNIFSRLEQSIMDLSKTDILSGEYDKKVEKRFRKYKRIGGEIFVKRMPALVTTSDDLKRLMKTLYNDYGFQADILILDYAAKMQSNTGRSTDDHKRISDVYIELGNLAIDMGIEHIWTANHVTREASRARMATRYKGEDIALCIDIVRHAQAIFGLNRCEIEDEANYFRMELVEQRDGKQSGRAVFNMNFDTQRATELTNSERNIYDEEIYPVIFSHEEQSDKGIEVSKKEKKKRKNDLED